MFFTLYAKIDGVTLPPAWPEGREVIAVFEGRADPKLSYIMWLEFRDGRISFIRDYRYFRYVTADAELTLVLEAKPAGNGAAQSRYTRSRSGTSIRLARSPASVHVHPADLRFPNAGAWHWDPLRFDLAWHLDAWCTGKGSPQFDLGERLESDGRNFTCEWDDLVCKG